MQTNPVYESSSSPTGPSRRGEAVQTAETGVKFIAIIDDDSSMRKALAGLMKASGFPARSYASAEEFLNSALLRLTACLVLDIRMPGMSGLDLHAELKARGVRIPTIFITAHGDEKAREQALSAGAVGYLTKPFDDEVLLEYVRAALTR
jgi:FixJ family two-component response regulator